MLTEVYIHIIFVSGVCQRLKFATPIDEMALDSYVIKNISVKNQPTTEDTDLSINCNMGYKGALVK